jgi:hypothetical protein
MTVSFSYFDFEQTARIESSSRKTREARHPRFHSPSVTTRKMTKLLLIPTLLFGAMTLFSVVPVVHSQFACTFSGASDEGSCVQTIEDDSNHHCVWCALSSSSDTVVTTNTMNTGGGDLGMCVSESQAETMEKTIPDLVRCDRYDGNTDDATPSADDDYTPSDDAAPNTDDAAPNTDDAAPNTDDKTPSNDDAVVPDDYWKCLLLKDVKTCQAASQNCTWCDTPVGFGVCMGGPSAEAAETSKWFTCRHEESTMAAPAKEESPTTVLTDPMDPSCALVYLQDPSKDACESAVDADGTPCEFCDLQGAFQLCLNADQAAMGEQFGLECGDDTVTDHLQDPMDPSCALIYLQDPSRDACEGAVDADGKACQFCNLQGAFELCLDADQAAMGEQFGLECGSDNDDETVTAAAVATTNVKDPMDPSCALVFLQDPSKTACEAAVDADGNACQFCNLLGAFELCLDADQAAMGEQFGLECGSDVDEVTVVPLQDPMDPSCALVYLQDPSKEACEAAVDANGNPCEFCDMQGSFQLCLNVDQAAMGEQFGLECGDDESMTTVSAIA